MIVAFICAVCFGYAAQRGGLCVVSGVTALLERRSPRLFLSFFRCSLWVAVVTLPIEWMGWSTYSASQYWPTLSVLLGGLLFGVGAAVNGGCSFGTLARLATGDLTFIISVGGMAAGVWLQHRIRDFIAAPLPTGTTILAMPNALTVALWGGFALLCVRELAVLRTAPPNTRWSPEVAALLMGISGGILYVSQGGWAYTLAVNRLVYAAPTYQIPVSTLAIISTATLIGAILSAIQTRAFRFRASFRVTPLRLVGGTLMGFGGALIPGGNGVLILQAMPALSPHALPAYASLILGSAGILYGSRWLRHLAHFPAPAAPPQ